MFKYISVPPVNPDGSDSDVQEETPFVIPVLIEVNHQDDTRDNDHAVTANQEDAAASNDEQQPGNENQQAEETILDDDSSLSFFDDDLTNPTLDLDEESLGIDRKAATALTPPRFSESQTVSDTLTQQGNQEKEEMKNTKNIQDKPIVDDHQDGPTLEALELVGKHLLQ